MNKKINKKKKGFTLIELIIVLAIMAIIAAIAIPNFTSVRDNSKEKADKQSRETIKRTVLMLVSDETIALPATNSKTGTLEFESDKSIKGFATGTTFTADTTTGSGTSAVTTKGEQSKIIEALHEVKAPQESGKVFKIEVSSSGDVKVTDK